MDLSGRRRFDGQRAGLLLNDVAAAVPAGRMGRPHLRTVFLDGPSNQIIWCSKEDTVSPATMRASGRGGVQLESLKEVRAVARGKRECRVSRLV